MSFEFGSEGSAILSLLCHKTSGGGVGFTRSYNPQRADVSSHHRVAGLRHLRHYPIVLACNPSPRGLLALAKGLAVSCSRTLWIGMWIGWV